MRQDEIVSWMCAIAFVMTKERVSPIGENFLSEWFFALADEAELFDFTE